LPAAGRWKCDRSPRALRFPGSLADEHAASAAAANGAAVIGAAVIGAEGISRGAAIGVNTAALV
jgi:hypothetical protein